MIGYDVSELNGFESAVVIPGIRVRVTRVIENSINTIELEYVDDVICDEHGECVFDKGMKMISNGKNEEGLEMIYTCMKEGEMK